MRISTPSSPPRPRAEPSRRLVTPSRRAVVAALGALGAQGALARPARAEAPADTGGLADLPLIRVDAERVAFVPAFAPTRQAPRVEHLAPFPPLDVLAEWARTHLLAAGTRGDARFIVREAGIVAVPLRERTANWRDWFRRQAVERYDGTVEVALEIRDEAGRVRAVVEARATQSAYLMDDWKKGDREKRLATLTEQMVGAALRRLAGLARADRAGIVRD